ncbi:ADP-ribose pyrophosphatase YjhB, NUDIX family [Prauserella marina]|uniref:ADP-ribose pyrophosphatase YjhB, NUDIX family n=1 Tax=Prauserella marina TaxID=530584 RepID=A0A1G6MPI0_9PSEU|nr:ADP-ribose pyrophosphatase YjhB (NUDIX family) [Prauserella marina]SDC56865.1 ADP-ribose pyrophosphatase YjhB, NUDIX family [Prauserella marina]
MRSHINSTTPLAHEVLAAVLQVRCATLRVLLWRRALDPHVGRWSLPGGRLRPDEDVEQSIRRQLAEKVDVKQLTHVEQLAVFSAPYRVPGPRVVATAFLGLVPSDVDPEVPEDTAWHPVDDLPRTAFDHEAIVLRARDRLRAKLSYTNLGFALAPREFTVSSLRELYSAALGYSVSATNLQRVLSRRGLLVPTGSTAPSGRAGGRPAALYSFAHDDMQVTDPFAVFKPPSPSRAPRSRTRGQARDAVT